MNEVPRSRWQLMFVVLMSAVMLLTIQIVSTSIKQEPSCFIFSAVGLVLTFVTRPLSRWCIQGGWRQHFLFFGASLLFDCVLCG